MRQQAALCVAFIDLDDFKHVNDTFGHRSGDRLLIQLSQRLSKACPESVVAGRLGGDEFVLLMPFGQDDPQVAEVSYACLEAAIAPFELENGTATIGASIGIVQARPQEGFSAVLSRADEAMYRIKRNGKNGVGLG